MNQLKSFTRVLLGLLMLSWLTDGCIPTDQAADPQATCRIQRIVSTATNGSDAETVYEYDPVGNLVGNVFTQHHTNQSDLTTVTKRYTYDAANFLTRAIVVSLTKTALPSGLSTWQITSTIDYTYTDNRLTAHVQRDDQAEQVGANSPQLRTTTTTGTYVYDAGGQLTQTTINGLTTTYQNNRVMNYTSPSPFTVENGLITKARFPGTNGTGRRADLTQTWQYDEQRRVVRYEEAINDSLTTYYTQAWQAGEMAGQSLPPLKGHPVIQSPFGELGVITNHQLFYVNQQQGGTVYLFSETTTASQLNTQGYVASATAKTTYLTNNQQPDVTTAVYTYTGCN